MKTVNTEIDAVTEFATWLTTRETVIKVGGSETVYAMWDALDEFQKMKQVEPAKEVGSLINRILAIAPSAGLYVGIQVQAAKAEPATT